MASERGQATLEWTALVLLVAVALGAVVAVAPRVDGRSFGGFLAHSISCAVRGGCDEDRRQHDSLLAAYGEDDAALVREYAPNIVYEPGTRTLPVDFRECRRHACSDASGNRDLDVHTTRRGMPATAFTHVLRDGSDTYIQYWLYYPDSTTTKFNAAGGWRHTIGRVTGRSYPGYHPDDWESYHVRIGADGTTSVRASSHHGYQGCKQHRCKNQWTDWTGWTRVSWGSHAGHIPLRRRVDGISVEGWPRPSVDVQGHDEPVYPGRDVRERTTTATGLRLIPLETLDTRHYFPLDEGIKPPWEKEVYFDPKSDSTS